MMGIVIKKIASFQLVFMQNRGQNEKQPAIPNKVESELFHETSVLNHPITHQSQYRILLEVKVI